MAFVDTSYLIFSKWQWTKQEDSFTLKKEMSNLVRHSFVLDPKYIQPALAGYIQTRVS